MKIANIATAKNQFSRLIDQVKHGETILITERDRPVARLQPLEGMGVGMASLHGSGLLNPPLALLDLAGFLTAPRSEIPQGNSLSAAICAEREEGR